MNVAVFTPTCRFGGLDVNYSGLCRQSGDHKITWLVADELLEKRAHLYEEVNGFSFTEVEIIAFREPKTGYRNLAASYNAAVRRARELGVDLFVSMQDYLWIPDDGVDRFAKLGEKYPNDIYTGLCSHSADPTAAEIDEQEGLWSIFRYPYMNRPMTIGWEDCRNIGTGVAPLYPVAWEANWAAIGKDCLYDEECYWDEAYDVGVAYENQDFAERATGCGHNIWIDFDNHSLALPHRAYFPWQEQQDVPHINQELHERKWG